MKKLMIAAAVICAAAMSQAAIIKWSGANVFTGYTGKGTDTANKVAVDTMVYLFDAATVSQADLWAAAKKAGADFDISKAGAVGSTTVTTAGAVPSTQTTLDNVGTGVDKTYYFAIVASDTENSYLYLSNLKDVTTAGSPTTPTSANFANQNSGTGTFSASAAKTDGSTGYWNTYASVPEPTSGLLLLLGVAGLALRRRRA